MLKKGRPRELLQTRQLQRHNKMSNRRPPSAQERASLFALLDNAKRAVAFTGAGVSTLSGIPDFRGPDGIYQQMDAQKIFDIDEFDRNPQFFYSHAVELVYGKLKEPSVVHQALAALEEQGAIRGIITQNIDLLHTRAGSKNVQEVHGSALRNYCRSCGKTFSFDEVVTTARAGTVPHCGCGGVIKPDIVFFGEALPEKVFETARELAEEADLILVLGTSLEVQPAASLPRLTIRNGGKLILINDQPTWADSVASLRLSDLASAGALLLEYAEAHKKT